MTNLYTFDVIKMDIMDLKQLSELTRDARRQLSVSWDFIIEWSLCVQMNSEMQKKQ